MKYRLVKLSAVFVVISTLLALCVCAEEFLSSDTVNVSMVNHIPTVPDCASLSGVGDNSNDAMYNYIAEQMKNRVEKIDVSTYNITKSDLGDIFSVVINTNYELYHINRTNYYYSSGNKVMALVPEYTEDAETVKATVEAMDEKIAYFLSYVDDSMTDLEKVITLHDRLALECEYDYSDNKYKYTAMSALLYGKCVCQGYTNLYYTLMKKLGIPCAHVKSKMVNHTWNAVYLDGNWYHLDITYDDPSYNYVDGYTRVSHSWLLKSNSYFLNTASGGGANHGTDFEQIPNDSTKYDDAPWNNVRAPLINLAGVIYYIDTDTARGSLYAYSTRTQTLKAIYTFTDVWLTADNRIWGCVYSGLAYSDGKLYFNTPTKIMSCYLDGSNVTEEQVIELSSDDTLYGIFEKNGKICYGIGKKADSSYIVHGATVNFNNNRTTHLFPVEIYVKNGKKNVAFVNETGSKCDFTIVTKNGNRVIVDDIVSFSKHNINVEVCDDDKTASLIVLDEKLAPLCEKIENI